MMNDKCFSHSQAPAWEQEQEREYANHNPTTLDIPAFLMNVPFSFSTDIANNAWMEDMDDDERKADTHRAMRQFFALYHHISSSAFVQIMPSPANCTLQDLVFTGNLGIVLMHLHNRNTVIISNFSSKSRIGEAQIGKDFFRFMGYEVFQPPFKFEGEAELKYLYDNVYIGGYGIRSDIRAYGWMEKNFDMRIIKIRETNRYLYHVDCLIFPLTPENTLVATEMLSKAETAEIGKHTNIVSVSRDEAFFGITNSVRLHNEILNASNICELKSRTKIYKKELGKNRKLEKIASDYGLTPCFFNLSEYMKSGALLSCMVMHLNRNSYSVILHTEAEGMLYRNVP